MSARYIIRFDDIAPGMAWSKFLPLKMFMEQLGINCLLGVVPACQDATLAVEMPRQDFFELIRQWKRSGDTVSQHGTFHVYETTDAGLLGINPRSEFAGLPYQRQLEKIQAGKVLLQREGLWEPYFMPPSHSFDANTIEALKAEGFVAITDGTGFFPYFINGLKFIPQLFGRPFPFAFGVITICVHVNSIDEKELDRLKRFMVKRRDRFVRFHEIAQEPVWNSWMSAALRPLTASLLKWARTIRKGSLGDLS